MPAMHNLSLCVFTAVLKSTSSSLVKTVMIKKDIVMIHLLRGNSYADIWESCHAELHCRYLQKACAFFGYIQR